MKNLFILLLELVLIVVMHSVKSSRENRPSLLQARGMKIERGQHQLINGSTIQSADAQKRTTALKK